MSTQNNDEDDAADRAHWRWVKSRAARAALLTHAYACPCCHSSMGYLEQVCWELDELQEEFGTVRVEQQIILNIWRPPSPDTLGMICGVCGWERDREEEESITFSPTQGPNGSSLFAYWARFLGKSSHQ